jgi:hypothetical protein
MREYMVTQQYNHAEYNKYTKLYAPLYPNVDDFMGESTLAFGQRVGNLLCPKNLDKKNAIQKRDQITNFVNKLTNLMKVYHEIKVDRNETTVFSESSNDSESNFDINSQISSYTDAYNRASYLFKRTNGSELVQKIGFIMFVDVDPDNKILYTTDEDIIY